jgi:hypothetical protein
VSARKPWRGPRPDCTSCVTHPSPPAALGKVHAAVSCSARRLPAYGAWVERHGYAAASPPCASQLPVCPLLCRGRVLHALPSGGPASIASACARALTTISACVCINLSPRLRVWQRVAAGSPSAPGLRLRPGALSRWHAADGLPDRLPRSRAAGREGRLKGTATGDMGERRGDAGGGRA